MVLARAVLMLRGRGLLAIGMPLLLLLVILLLLLLIGRHIGVLMTGDGAAG